jgi:1,4-dihydroxy-2-naphthoate octaprenyltransferase
MEFKNLKEYWVELTLLGLGAVCLVVADFATDLTFVVVGCTALIVAMISAVGKSIAEEIRKNGGVRDA